MFIEILRFPTRYGKWCFFLFFFLHFLLLFSLLFWFFSLLHTHFFDANTRYMIYELAHTTVTRKLHGTNVQSLSNHKELASIGHGNRKDIVWLTKEWQGEKIRDVYTFGQWSSPVVVEVSCLPMDFGDGGCWIFRNGDVGLVRSFETSQRTQKTESGCKRYGQNRKTEMLFFVLWK